MRRIGLLAFTVLLIGSGNVFAQEDTSRSEFSAGWRFYHATIRSFVTPIQVPLPNDFQKGWYADVAFNLSPKFAIVGDVGGTYHSDDYSQTSGAVAIREEADLRLHTFMAGVRVRAPHNRTIVPFGQVLFGGEHDRSTNERSITVFQNTSTSRREQSTSSAVLALDAGVTLMHVRASVGYVRFFSRADSDALRVSLGGAFRF